MRSNPLLNGCDYLMLGFDHELRRHGFSGNSCQVVLELGTGVSRDALSQRVAVMLNRHPILGARPGGILRPRWKVPRQVVPPPVRVHRHEAGLSQRLLNEPLACHRGELVRFDLIEGDGGRASLVFTWAHALMDAPAAEHFLAVLGGDEPNLPAQSSTPSRHAPLPWPARCRLAWKYLHQLDDFCRAAPRSLGVRFPDLPPRLHYRVESFSANETARVRENGARLGGVLGDAQYHAAAALVELHRLHLRLGCPTPSYVLPVPVGLRLKGSIDPLFSNQVTLLMHQFLPEHLDSVEHAVTTLKARMAQAMRAGLLESGRLLSEMFRFLPLPIYMAILKRGLRGEICSLFYGDTAAVNPRLTRFLGSPIEDFRHVAAVTPAPGLGVLFYSFRGELRITVLHSLRVLSEEEATEFATNLRRRLLDP